MERVYEYDKVTLGVVSKTEIKVGDIFEDGYNTTTKESIKKQVVNILEQRPERGELKDESNRKFWAKVTVI